MWAIYEIKQELENFFSMKVAPAAVCSWPHHRLFPLHLLFSLQLYPGLHELSKAFGTVAALAALTGDPAFISSIIKMTLKVACGRFTAFWSLSKVLKATWISAPWCAYSLAWDCKPTLIVIAQDWVYLSPGRTWREGGHKMCYFTSDMVFIFFLMVKVIAFGPLLSMSKCNLFLRDRMGEEISKGLSSSLAFTCSVKSSANRATSAALAPQLFLCFLMQGRRSKRLNQVHSPTWVWASPGSRSVRPVTVRLISLKNSSPC